MVYSKARPEKDRNSSAEFVHACTDTNLDLDLTNLSTVKHPFPCLTPLSLDLRNKDEKYRKSKKRKSEVGCSGEPK